MRMRGMTLIEITIALCIAALMVTIAIPAISSITRAQLRQKAGQMAGGLRSLYGASALRSASCRLVIDLDNSSYVSECAKGTVRISSQGEKSQEGHRENSKDEDLVENAKLQEGLSDQDKARLELLQKSAFTASNDIPKTELGKEVLFKSVWVEHQPEPYSAGKAFIYYWPSGIAEDASIQLEQGDDVMTLIVSQLTGRVQVVKGPADSPSQKK
jgi:general secretion pathway protein H